MFFYIHWTTRGGGRRWGGRRGVGNDRKKQRERGGGGDEEEGDDAGNEQREDTLMFHWGRKFVVEGDEGRLFFPSILIEWVTLRRDKKGIV